MTRKKVKLAFIVNDSARKATYKKRKKGLLKKMDELTTLCDVKACAILYSPYEAQPLVWPSSSGAGEVIESFKRLPEMEKAKKMVSQEEFLRQRVAKAHEQLEKIQKENREKEMTQVMYQCLSGKSMHNLSLLDLSDLGWVIDQHLNEINKRIESLKKENPLHNNNNNDNDNINNTNNNNNINNTSATNISQSEQPLGLSSGQSVDIDAMQMQMMMQQWPSFRDMAGPSMVHGHYHQHPHYQQTGKGVIGSGLYNAGESSSSGSNLANNNQSTNNSAMMMGSPQYGGYNGQGVNSSPWSSNTLIP